MKNKFMRKVKWFAKPEASEPLNYLNFGFADVCHFVGLERIIVNLTDVLLPLVCTPLCILLLLDFASWKCTGMFFPILLSVTILNLNRNKARSGRRQRHEKTKQSGGIKLLPHSAFNSASAQNTVQKKKKKKTQHTLTFQRHVSLKCGMSHNDANSGGIEGEQFSWNRFVAEGMEGKIKIGFYLQ